VEQSKERWFSKSLAVVRTVVLEIFAVVRSVVFPNQRLSVPRLSPKIASGFQNYGSPGERGIPGRESEF
jgi:hypothetical protein